MKKTLIRGCRRRSWRAHVFGGVLIVLAGASAGIDCDTNAANTFRETATDEIFNGIETITDAILDGISAAIEEAGDGDSTTE